MMILPRLRKPSAIILVGLACGVLPLNAQKADDQIGTLVSSAKRISVHVPDGHLTQGSKTSYTLAMSDHYPAPKIVQGPKGILYLAYNDKNRSARVLVLDQDFKSSRELFRVSGKMFMDIVSDDDGLALFLADFDVKQSSYGQEYSLHTARISKYNFEGKQMFSTAIVGTRTYTKEGDQGISDAFANFSIEKSSTQYAVYFTTYRRWDDGVTHQSEYLAFFDKKSGQKMMDDSGKSPLGFTWNVSHSFRPRFVYDGERFVMATVGDAYPRELVLSFFPNSGRHTIVDVPKAGQGETYQYVGTSVGDLFSSSGKTWLVFDSAIGKPSYDIGVVSIDGDVVSKPTWITNTPGVRERIPRIISWGKDRLLVMWGVDSGKDASKWFPSTDDISLQGSFIDSSGKSTVPTNFGSKGQFMMRGATRFFQTEKGIGWVNDITGLADQLEVIFIPYKGSQNDESISDENSENTDEITDENIDENIDETADETVDETDENVNDPENEANPQTTKIDPKLNYPFLDAIYEGNESEAIALLKKGADPDAKFKEWAAIHYAAYFGRVKVARELAKRKVNANALAGGHTALSIAESQGHTEIVKILKPITTLTSRATTRSVTPHSLSKKPATKARRDVQPSLKNLGGPKKQRE